MPTADRRIPTGGPADLAGHKARVAKRNGRPTGDQQNPVSCELDRFWESVGLSAGEVLRGRTI
jgi:hypothetical protein